MWVLGRNLQLDANGQEIAVDDQQYIFEESLLNRVDIPIQVPKVTGSAALSKLTSCMKGLLAENFISALFVMGGMVMSVHAELIMKHRKACPMVMAWGPTKCGKTTALNCAAAMIGTKIWGTGSSKCPRVTYFHDNHTKTEIR